MALHSARRAATAYCYWDLVESPLPSLIVAVDADGRLLEIRFDRRRPEGRRDAKRCKGAASQLGEYFAGKRREFELTLAPVGTEFQLRVWNALRAIPYGETCSYAELADRIGAHNAQRAVGAANGKNPVAIIVPCHRVLRTGGALGGYTGGLERKEFLLRLEGMLL